MDHNSPTQERVHRKLANRRSELWESVARSRETSLFRHVSAWVQQTLLSIILSRTRCWCVAVDVLWICQHLSPASTKTEMYEVAVSDW